MIPKNNLDYVKSYAKALKKNPQYFKQQKMLIEIQLRSSRQVFRNKFGEGEEFKTNARKYLKNTGKL